MFSLLLLLSLRSDALVGFATGYLKNPRSDERRVGTLRGVTGLQKRIWPTNSGPPPLESLRMVDKVRTQAWGEAGGAQRGRGENGGIATVNPDKRLQKKNPIHLALQQNSVYIRSKVLKFMRI